MNFVAEDTNVNEIAERAHKDIIENERRRICQQGAKKQLNRVLNHHRVEHEHYLEDIKRKNTYSHVQSNLEKEEKLALALKDQKRAEITDIKIRQQLRETDLDLRELESKLRAAYITKELSAQIAEKQYFQAKKKLADKETNEILQSSLRSTQEQERLEAEEEIKRKMEYKKELHDQMIYKYQQKENNFEEFLKEKKMIDDVIQRMHDEDTMELEERMYQMKKNQEEIRAFKEAQKIWKDKETKAVAEENRRIMEYMNMKEKESQSKAAQRLADQEAKDKAMEELIKKSYIAQLQKKEREEILQDLVIEEIKEKEDEKYQQEVRKQIQRRLEWQETLDRQIEEQKQKLRQEELEDKQYKEMMLRKIMEDERIELMTREKKQRKMVEIRLEVEETMKERRAKRAEELRNILYSQEQEKMEEDKKRKIIEDERLKLLKEHATNLIGYLPPGVLRADDLPHLGCEVLQHYSAKH